MPPITAVLNNEVLGECIRWSTPSIILSQDKLKDMYASDISVSTERIGDLYIGGLCDKKGIFKQSKELAAETYGSYKTFYSVNGSTGSNFICLWYLKEHFQKKGEKLNLLSTKNIHKSIIYASEFLNFNIQFTGFDYDPKFDLFIPRTPEQIEKKLLNNPEINAVLLINPTYGGLSMYLKETIERIKEVDEDIVIYVDEAWGSQFGFHPEMPESAIKAGADIAVQSIHKQGGALQQTGLIHLNKRVIDFKLFERIFNHFTTTSPSYILLSSIDSVVRIMNERGEEVVDEVVKNSKLFRKLLKESVPENVNILTQDYVFDKCSDYVKDMDPTKTVIDLSKIDITGGELSEILQKEYKIVPEKCHPNTITFLTTYQLTEENIKYTSGVISEILNSRKESEPVRYKIPRLKESPISYEEVLKKKESDFEKVSFKECVSKICGENITPYPPGIPVVIKGDIINEEMKNYLLRLVDNDIHIVKGSEEKDKLLVLKE